MCLETQAQPCRTWGIRNPVKDIHQHQPTGLVHFFVDRTLISSKKRHLEIKMNHSNNYFPCGDDDPTTSIHTLHHCSMRRSQMLLQHLFPQNNNNNIHSHHISTSTTPMEWNHCSGPTTKSTTTTQNMKNEPLEEGEDSDQHIRLVPKQVSLPVKIAGIGRYLPPYIVPSSTIDILCGKPKGFTEKTTGIKERR